MCQVEAEYLLERALVAEEDAQNEQASLARSEADLFLRGEAATNYANAVSRYNEAEAAVSRLRSMIGEWEYYISLLEMDNSRLFTETIVRAVSCGDFDHDTEECARRNRISDVATSVLKDRLTRIGFLPAQESI
jgi:hypothetical protein